MVTPVTCDRCRESFGNPHDIVTARAKQQLITMITSAAANNYVFTTHKG